MRGREHHHRHRGITGFFFGDGDAPAVSLQWTFAENDLTIPSEMELREGLVCWTDPASDLCAEREP